MIDWSKAPEGATHLRLPSTWYQEHPLGLMIWDDWEDSGKSFWEGSSYSSISSLMADWPGSVIPRPVPVEPPATLQEAAGYCRAALGHMVDRASTYDAPAGERSMTKTVAAFNTITGHSLTEEQGWLFMEVLKIVRSQQGEFKQDNYEDAVAYAALRGEAAEKERRQ